MFVSPKTMALLMALDVPKEQIAELFASLNEDAQMMQAPGGERSAGAIRQQRLREKRAAEAAGVTRDVTSDATRDVTDPSSSPEEKVSPTPPSKTQTLSTPHPPIVPPPQGEKPRVVARNGDFEAWYARFPNKIGRGAAEKAFRLALAKTNIDVLMAGLEVYVRTKPVDRPWCNPATWLNQERWLDIPAQAPTAEPKRVSWC